MLIKKFLKNSFFMFFGQSIITFIGFILIGIYAHSLGKEGFGVFGIISSFIAIIMGLDISFYFPLVIYINKFKDKSNETVNKIIESIFFFSWITNIFLIPLLILISYWLCLNVYSIPSLFKYLVISIIMFALLRTSRILLETVRVFQKEKWFQITRVSSNVLGAILIIYLLIFFKMGIYSIFIGGLFASLIEYAFLIYFIKKLNITLKPRISMYWIKKIFKEVIGYSYLIKSSENLIKHSSLFVSSIFLTITSLGMLTIVIKVLNILFEFSFILPIQLSIVFSTLIHKKDYESIKNISLLISNLNIIILGFIFLIIFTILDKFMLFYLSDVYNGLIFKIILFGFLFNKSFIPFSIFFQLYNMSLFSKINCILTLSFVISMIFISKFFGLVGISLLISLVYLIQMIIRNILSFKILNISFKEFELNKVILAVCLIVIYLSTSTKNIFINILIFLILSITYLACSFRSFKDKLDQLRLFR